MVMHILDEWKCSDHFFIDYMYRDFFKKLANHVGTSQYSFLFWLFTCLFLAKGNGIV
jgi:hypothetical protein